MRAVVSTLVVVCLLAILGCDSNDENTLNSIPKSHKLNPAFTVAIENNHKTIPGREIQLTVDPSIGWTGEVFTDSNGFVSTLAAGTFVATIDTTIRFPGTDSSDTVADTTYVTYGFLPSQTYTFGLSRVDPLQWVDTVSLVYARTIDSSWIKGSASEYVILLNMPTYDTLLFDSVAMILDPADTVGNSPITTLEQELLRGYWFDTAYVITNPADTVNFPPDSTSQVTVLWGFWGDTVTFGHVITPDDSGNYCIDITGNGDWMCFWTLDTVTLQGGGGWGNYDTTNHTLPDTTKGLILGATDLSIYNWVLKESGFVGDTVAASLYLIDQTLDDTTIWDSPSFQITMPSSDVKDQPDYKIVIENALP